MFTLNLTSTWVRELLFFFFLNTKSNTSCRTSGPGSVLRRVLDITDGPRIKICWDESLSVTYFLRSTIWLCFSWVTMSLFSKVRHDCWYLKKELANGSIEVFFLFQGVLNPSKHPSTSPWAGGWLTGSLWAQSVSGDRGGLLMCHQQCNYRVSRVVRDACKTLSYHLDTLLNWVHF